MPFVSNKRYQNIPSVGKKNTFVSFHGFTLVELIVTLTVAGILLGIAAPQFFNFVASNRLATQINDFSAALSTARSEALTRHTTAGVCTSNGGASCAAGSWENGWLVFYVCPTGDTTCAVVGANVPIATHEALTGGNTLSGAASTILYDKTGVVSSGTGTYTLCDSKYKQERTVTIISSGRPTIGQGPC